MLACPLCHSTFPSLANHASSHRCPNKACILFDHTFSSRKGVPILIPPDAEYSIVDVRPQSEHDIFPLIGFQDRFTSSSLLSLRQNLHDFFYQYNRLELPLYRHVYSRLPANANVLVVGGGNLDASENAKLDWVKLFLSKGARFCVTDIYMTENLHCMCDAHYLPFSNESFDAVIVTTVLEHVLSPSRVVSEIHRVLRNNGIIYATVPFNQCVHEGAFDFTRFTLNGQRWLFRHFDEVKASYLVGACCSWLYNITSSISLVFRFKPLGLFVRLILWQPCFIIDRLLPRSVHINQALCNYFLGQKNNSHSFIARDLISYYDSMVQPKA